MILIAGGTGFIGSYLVNFLAQKGYRLSVLSRKEMPAKGNITYYNWDVDKNEIDVRAFNNVDTIINLTGANIGDKRWTKRRKQELLNSRINSIDLLYRCVSENNINIKNFISSSAVGYYGTYTSENIFNEQSPKGKDFLAYICEKWETAARKFETLNANVVLLRKGIVLGNGGGVYTKLSFFAKYALTPIFGDGKQYVPWIQIDDLLHLYAFLLENKHLTGVFNAVATEHINMNQFVIELMRSYNKGKYPKVHIPAAIIRIMFGEMSCTLLEGSRMCNQKIKENGFCYSLDYLKESLENLRQQEKDKR